MNASFDALLGFPRIRTTLMQIVAGYSPGITWENIEELNAALDTFEIDRREFFRDIMDSSQFCLNMTADAVTGLWVPTVLCQDGVGSLYDEWVCALNPRLEDTHVFCRQTLSENHWCHGWAPREELGTDPTLTELDRLPNHWSF